MNDTQPGYYDPDDEQVRHEIDPDETIPPRRMPTRSETEYVPGSFRPLPDDTEQIPTPPNLPRVNTMGQATPPRRRSSPMLGCLAGLALVLALLSVLLNVYLIYVLMSVRQTAVENVDAAIQALEDFRGAGFHYEYRFDQNIPVMASIPIQQQMTIPFEGDFPINTTIEVPIDAGLLGTFVVDVPINTSVYVETEVPVNIDQTFVVSTSVPISMTVPIDVGTDDPEIEGVLGRVQQWLLDLRDSLSRGFVPTWLPTGND